MVRAAGYLIGRVDECTPEGQPLTLTPAGNCIAIMVRSKNMQIKQNVDIIGLLGFSFSGAMFVISALRTGDQFALAGSIIWILSCIGWILALICREV